MTDVLDRKPPRFSDRDARFKKAPASPLELELLGLIGKAVALGRIEIQCIKKRLTWAAYYSEKKKLDLMVAAFVNAIQNDKIVFFADELIEDEPVTSPKTKDRHAPSKSPKVKRPKKEVNLKTASCPQFGCEGGWHSVYCPNSPTNQPP